MIAIEGPEDKLAKVENGGIAKPTRPLTVGQLELALLSRYPRADAESWDRMGLLVGDPAALVSGVAVALDPTTEALEAAQRAGANVLLTHHPVFLEPPQAFSPSYSVAAAPGVHVWKAISAGIALINLHTALDVSIEATHVLPQMLSLEYDHLAVPLPTDARKGYGPICNVRASDQPFTLERLAARCVSVFGHTPRVWGDMSQRIEQVAVANGAAGNVIDACLAEGVGCLVCGEIRYHAALDAVQAGFAVIELGHDVSELPLCALLAQAAIEAGVDQSKVFIHDQSGNWAHPDSTRI